MSSFDLSTGVASLISLCLSGLLLFATLSWMVNHRRARLSNAWLVALVFLIMLQSAEFLYHATDAFIIWPFFLKFVDPVVILLPFTLFGFIRALQGENVARPRKRLLINILPAAVVALLDVPYWSLPATEKIEWMMKVRISESSWEPLAPYGNDYLAIIALLGFVYWRRQRQLGYAVTDRAARRWVDKLQTLQMVVVLLLVTRIILSTLFGTNVSMVFTLMPAVAWLLLQFLMPAQTPSSTQNASQILDVPVAVDDVSLVASEDKEVDKTLDAGLSLLFQELERKMLEQVYLDNELSLGKLAALCGMSTHQASAAINQCSGSNFYDWVNSYRVYAAQQALIHTNIQVAKVCYEVGFNSKSTFNAAFKKISGCTPTEYRVKYKN